MPPKLTDSDTTNTEESNTATSILSVLKTVMFGILNWVIVPIAIVLILHNFVFQAFHVLGTSMTPTLHESDYLIISKLGATGSKISKLFGKQDSYIPKRDEIVVFHYPKDPSLVFVKRVIGLPGERVVVKDGKVTIYNNANPEGFDPDKGLTLSSDISLGTVDDTVPTGQIFVMGDNRLPNGSFDSREWGFLPSSYIVGEAVMRLLPVANAKFF